MSEADITLLDAVIALLQDSSGYLDATLVSEAMKTLLKRMLSWPAEHTLPGEQFWKLLWQVLISVGQCSTSFVC
jgi:hypothetical protein